MGHAIRARQAIMAGGLALSLLAAPATLAAGLDEVQAGNDAFSAGRYEAALAELAEAGWVREAPVRAGDRPGRRRKDWAVNPALAGCPS